MQVVKEIEGSGGKAVAVKADVSKIDDVQALFKAATEAFPEEKIEVGYSWLHCIITQAGGVCHNGTRVTQKLRNF